MTLDWDNLVKCGSIDKIRLCIPKGQWRRSIKLVPHAIKSRKKARHIPIIFLSGRNFSLLFFPRFLKKKIIWGGIWMIRLKGTIANSNIQRGRCGIMKRCHEPSSPHVFLPAGPTPQDSERWHGGKMCGPLIIYRSIGSRFATECPKNNSWALF